MKNLKFCTLALGLLLLASSCSRSVFVAHDADARLSQHQQIAILPVDVIFSGKKPRNISEAEIEKIRKDDSFLFQHSIYRQANRRTKKSSVQLQAIEVTNQKLMEANINVHDLSPEALNGLADFLGVDAVLKSQVRKRNYLTRGQSLGVAVATQVGQQVLTESGNSIPNFPTRQLTKTDDITVSCMLIDGKDGTNIYSNSKRGTANWRRDYHVNVYRVNRRVMKKLPY